MPAAPLKFVTFTTYWPPPAQTLVPAIVRLPTPPLFGARVAPLPTSTTPLPSPTVPAPPRVAFVFRVNPFCTNAVPPLSTLKLAAAVPLPTVQPPALVVSVAFSTVKLPPLSTSCPPPVTVKLLANTVPASSWKVPLLFTHPVELLPAPVTLTVAPLTTSAPPLATSAPTVPPLAVRVQVPAPTLLNVPLLVTNVPPKFVLPSPHPTCTVLLPRLIRPLPVSSPTVPSFWKFTWPLPVTPTVTPLVSAATLPQLNVPPLLTSRLLLPTTCPLTASTPPLTTVSPVYVLVPVSVAVPPPAFVSEPLPLRFPL